MYLTACKFLVTHVWWTVKKLTQVSHCQGTPARFFKHSCTLHEAYGLRTLFVHTTWHINGHNEEERSKTQWFLPAKRFQQSEFELFCFLNVKQHKKTKRSKITVSGVYFYSQRSLHSLATSNRLFLLLKSKACCLAPLDHSLEEA